MRGRAWVVLLGACACGEQTQARGTIVEDPALLGYPPVVDVPPGPPAFSALESLPQDLLGDWITDDYSGNCRNDVDYLRVAADGEAAAIRIDADFCTPDLRGSFVTPAKYSLDGRELTLRVAQTADAYESVERSSVASASWSDERLLYTTLYVPVDPQHWRQTYLQESYDAGVLMYRTATSLDLRFDVPVTIGEGAGSVELEYSVDSYVANPCYDACGIQEPKNPSTAHSGPFEVHFGPGALGQRIELRGVPEEGNAALPLLFDEMVHLPGQPDSGLYRVELWVDPTASEFLFTPQSSYRMARESDHRLGDPP